MKRIMVVAIALLAGGGCGAAPAKRKPLNH
jgi:hypothetical protein